MALGITDARPLLLVACLLLPSNVSVVTAAEVAPATTAAVTAAAATAVLCECNQRLLPNVKNTSDLLGFLLVVLEEAQGHAALNVVKRREGRVAMQPDIPAIPDVGPELTTSSGTDNHQLGGPLFLKDMSTVLSSIENLQSVMIQTRIVQELEGIQRSVSANLTTCPVDYMIQAYKNLTSMLTDAVHYRENVKADTNLASDTLIEVRRTVVSMKEKLTGFGLLLKDLHSAPCLKPESTQSRSLEGQTSDGGPPSDGSLYSYGEPRLSDDGPPSDVTPIGVCHCVEQLLPVLRNLTGLMDWVLQIRRETQARAAWTVKVASEAAGGDIGRSADRISYRVLRSVGENEDRSKRAAEPDHSLGKSPEIESFREEDIIYTDFENTSISPMPSGNLNVRMVLEECPVSQILELRQSFVNGLTDALQYREYVKDDPAFANYLLELLPRLIKNLEKYLEEYKFYVKEMENSNCNFQTH